jgi:uncharacterized protein (TIGR00730 family)
MDKVLIDELADENLSLEDMERSVKYAHDLTRGLAKIKTYPQGVTVFGSARLTENDPYYQLARQLGGLLANQKIPVITGGGYGIMEAANRGAFEAGGRSIGLNIQLPREQQLNKYTTDSLQFHYFFARKVMLAFSAKVYVFFPGGFGTMDELSEILTLVQTGKVPTMPIVLIGVDFWTPLDKFFHDQLEVAEHTIAPGDRNIYTITDDINYVVELASRIASRPAGEVMSESISKAL